MKHKITHRYCWYKFDEDLIMIVKMYFINEVPFTFDELPEIATDDPEIISMANHNLIYDAERLYKSSGYLIMEECHPCFFELDLENPECLPCD
jgi:hypothetical protein